jgi:hypothetical protein
MENNFNSAKEASLLNLYASYLQDTGVAAYVSNDADPDSLQVLQIPLSNQENLHLLFVPLGDANFKTISLIQFYTVWRGPKRNELDALKLINALNQKIPVGKLSSNFENNLEYHYYIPVSSSTPLTKEEFVERVSLILMQIEFVFSIWPLEENLSVLLEKVNKI